MTSPPDDIVDLRIDVLKRESAALKAAARERMHDSGAIGAIAHRLRQLEAEIKALRRARLAERPTNRLGAGNPR